MLQPARPPHVMFETRAIEDRQASMASDIIRYKDVDFVVITPVGGKDVVEKIASEWLADIRNKSHVGLYDREWSERFSRMYELYKQDKEMPIDGTPLRMCLMFSPAEIKACESVNIRTLEDAAAMNEEAVGRVGMGARSIKDKANAAISQSQGTGKIAQEIAALKVDNERLSKQLEEAIRRLNELGGKMPGRRGRPPKEDKEEAVAA